MSKTIWKFDLDFHGQIEVPAGGEILSVQMQGDQACVWALVEPSAARETVHLRIYGTGHDVPDDPGKFIDTFQMHGGALVFHVFESAREVRDDQA